MGGRSMRRTYFLCLRPLLQQQGHLLIGYYMKVDGERLWNGCRWLTMMEEYEVSFKELVLGPIEWPTNVLTLPTSQMNMMSKEELSCLGEILDSCGVHLRNVYW